MDKIKKRDRDDELSDVVSVFMSTKAVDTQAAVCETAEKMKTDVDSVVDVLVRHATRVTSGSGNPSRARRNEDIIKQYLQGKSDFEIGQSYGLGSARVRQVLTRVRRPKRADDAVPYDLMKEVREKGRELVKDYARVLIRNAASGLVTKSPYERLCEQYGKEQIDSMKAQGYNAYRELTDERNKVLANVLKSGVSGTVLSTIVNISRDRIYGIAHEQGVRKLNRLTPVERTERDKAIREMYDTSGDYRTVADAFKLSKTMVSIIVNKDK